MSSSIGSCCHSGASGAILCCGATVVVGAVITTLVIGILGATGVIEMAPLAADWMLGTSSALILVMIKMACGCYNS